MSEDREAVVQKELMAEVQRRRVVEQSVNEQADRVIELEDRLQVLSSV